jgi:hypothetical protein
VVLTEKTLALEKKLQTEKLRLVEMSKALPAIQIQANHGAKIPLLGKKKM